MTHACAKRINPALSRADAAVVVRRSDLLKPVGRWTPNRKRDLLVGLENAVLTAAEAMAAHDISADELAGWRRNWRTGGVADLRQKTIQQRGRRLSRAIDRAAAHP